MKNANIEKIIVDRIEELKDMEKDCKTETGQEKFMNMRTSLEILIKKLEKLDF